MKKTFIFLLFLASFCGFSQGITIDPTYTPNQLINGVLINSPCTTGSNINASTGTNFGSTNGIGYFENLNPNFPFAKGIVLMTGDVTKVPSPNTTVLSDGTNAWPGDADLEANLLSQSAVTINSVNASYIEFEFVAKNASLAFDFVFASEEYGTSQCDYSDAFAFLLKNVTGNGPNVNLAIVPSTANTPISVATIRDNLYNTQCPSVNANFFGSFNGGGFGPAINFNGQTKKMTASANGLVIGNTYRIKIVIADGSDNTGYDSAIFLNANSFNTNANVLGPDVALCSGLPLPTLQPSPALTAGTTYVWKLNGVIMPGQTSSSLNLTTATPAPVVGINTYTLVYTEPGCSALEDDKIIEIYAPVNALATVPDYYLCTTSGPNFSFDLTKVTTTILTSNTTAVGDDLPAGTLVTYFLTPGAADIGTTGQLASPHVITIAEDNKTIYARIQNPVTGCYTVRSFHLKIVPPPTIITVPANITLCGRNLTDTPPRATFNTLALVNTILGGSQDPSIYNVTFHSSQANAVNNATPLRPNAAFLTVSRNMWIRVTNITDPTCFVVSSTFFQLIVTPLPDVDMLTDVVVCTSYTLPVLTQPGAKYFTATNGGGTERPAGYVVTGAPGSVTTIHIYNESGICKANRSFKVTIANVPGTAPANATYCTEYALPPLAYGKYFQSAGGTGTEYLAGHNITTTTTLYYRFVNNTDAPFCAVEQAFTITIIPFVELDPVNFPNLFGCSNVTLPNPPAGVTYYTATNKGLPVIPGGTVINATKQIFAYKESGTSPVNCTSEVPFTAYVGLGDITPPTNVTSCASYPLPALTVGEYRTAAAGGGSPIAAGTLIGAGVHTIYYYVPGQSCTDNLSFTVTVNIEALPAMPDVGPVCDVYYLPAVAHTGDYYTGPGGTGTKRPVGFPITSTQTIYFYDKAPTGNCFVENDIVITINQSPPITSLPVEVIRCNVPYALGTLANGHYYSLQGGPTALGQTLRDNTSVTTSETIWVYSESPDPGNTCFQEYKIDVFIFNTVVNEVPDVFACDSYTLPAIVGPGDYYTATGGPTGTGTIVPAGTVVNTTTTYYIYAENNTRVTCSDEKDVVVTIYNTPVVAPITPVVACDTYLLPALVAPATKYFTLPNGGGTQKFVNDPITISQTVYAYAESGTVGTQLCTDDEPLVITINNTPVIAAIAPVYACDSYTLPAPVAPATKYVTANDGTGIDVATGTVINTSTILYAYAETGTLPNCFTYSPLNITIYTTPVVAPLTPVIACDTYLLPALIAPATKYFTLPNGAGTQKFANDPITISQTVYAYAESGTVGTQLCTDDEPLVITINNTPVIAPIAPVNVCDSYTLPAPAAPATKYVTANDGTGTDVAIGTVINTSTILYAYAETGTLPNCTAYQALNITITPTPVLVASEVADVNTCNSYTLPALSTPGANYYTGSNGSGTIIPVGTVYTSSILIYAYAASGTVPCFDNEDIAINIYNVDEPAAVINCGTYTLPALTAVGAAYYSLPNGVSPITQVTATQNVYVYGTSPSGCTDEFMFSVTINANAVFNPVPATLTTVCDTDSDVDDFVTDFDLDSLTATILGSQNPAFYSVSYYPSLGDATVMTNQITTDNGPLTDTRLTEIWVRVSDGGTTGCEDIDRVVITVIPQPHLEPLEGVICYESQTGTGTPHNFVTGYSSSLYTFDWKDATGSTVSTAANFSTSTPGVYQLTITAIGVTGCQSAPITATAIESSKPASVTYEVLSGWFTENQTLEITATPFIGNGSNLRYSIDGQDAVVGSASPTVHVFTNVSSGPHEITVFDINGCGATPVPIPVQMVYSPKFFSPNGDGVNDVWKIQGFEYDPTAKLYIFDRFGRLLKEIFVNNNDGWDGNINGQPLPGNDYWFTIRYTENGISKEYKSHFALVR